MKDVCNATLTLHVQVRNMRNKLLHSDNLKVTDSKLTDSMNVMVTLLEDRTTLFDDSAAQEAVHELKGVNMCILSVAFRIPDIILYALIPS